MTAHFAPEGHALFTYCARSALDLWFHAIALPAGSEVLYSALTIPHMPRIAEAHGLVPVPVDLEPETLLPDPKQVLAAAGPRSRVLVVAPLFGARPALDSLRTLARERNWLFVEDCAQAFDGKLTARSADLVLYSFGAIKTATAAAGGVAVVRDAAVAARMGELQSTWPLQTRRDQGKRLMRIGVLMLLGCPPIYGALDRLCRRLGRDRDGLVSGWARSFPGTDWLSRLRRQPSAALGALLLRRLRGDVAGHVAARAARGRELLRRIGSHALPGGALAVPGLAAGRGTHWVLPVGVDSPDELVRALGQAGFDGSRRSSLEPVPVPRGHGAPEPRTARILLQRMVFLPLDTPLPPRDWERLVDVLLEHARTHRTGPFAGAGRAV